MRKISGVQSIVSGILMFLIISGCNQTEIPSFWKNKNIVIDGDDEEWQDVQMVLKGKSSVFGVINDNSNLYISFRTADRTAIMQAISHGFTVWFDPKGGRKEILGIKYPLGDRVRGGRGPMGNRGFSPGEMENRIQEQLSLQSGIQIHGPEKDQVTQIPLINREGIELKSTYSMGQFVYELKIPFKSKPTQLYAVDAEPGDVIGIGFKTGTINREAMRNKMMSRKEGGAGRGGGMRPGGGMGGGGLRPGGGGMGMRGGGMGPKMPESLEIWTKVILAGES